MTEQERANSLSAYNLLHKWKIIPGLENGTLNDDFLKKWITEVQKKATNVKRLSIVNLIIGHLLFHSPADKSGLWINKTVAGILNRIENIRMREGFHTEAVNSRGVYSVDFTGESELEIANTWKTKAEALSENGFYELASTVMDLYNMYLDEAKRAKSMKRPDNFTYFVKKDDEDE